MRLEAKLIADSDAQYDNTYHYAFRGRLFEALEGTRYYQELHDSGNPVPLTFSNPFPYPSGSDGHISEGDRMYMRIASPDREILKVLAGDFSIDSHIYAGEMSFRVDEFDLKSPDVGGRGSTGVLRTDTGVVCQIPPYLREEYNIDAPEDSDSDTFWRRKHGMDPFVTQITRNLDRKHELFGETNRQNASELDVQLFDSYDFVKDFAVPVTVTAGHEHEYILSKWDLGYTIQNEQHRRLLNLLLDVGIGQKNSYGFGFVNVHN